jgi:hypothetical protein
MFGARSVRCSSSLPCDKASTSWDGGTVTDSTRESVGDNVGLSRYMSYVGHELGYEIEVVELQR